MRIACLQFAPKLGALEDNLARATELLDAKASALEGVDFLVLPELVFSGYNFSSLAAITPFLEPTCAGPSTAWAQRTAQKYNCYVTVGYPEVSNEHPQAQRQIDVESHSVRDVEEEGITHDSTTTNGHIAPPASVNYNSTVTVDPSGSVVAHYRKSFLYYTDETWASEPTPAFHIACRPSTPPADQEPLNIKDFPLNPSITLKNTKICYGICMDLNPYRFTAPWDKREFGHHVSTANARLVFCSMAWLASPHNMATPDEYALGKRAQIPDIETIQYWLERVVLPEDTEDGEEGSDGEGDGTNANARSDGVEGRAEVGESAEAGHEHDPGADDHVGTARRMEAATVDGSEGRERVFVFANRCGREGDACYAGSSAVFLWQGGRKVVCAGLLGRAEEGILIVEV